MMFGCIGSFFFTRWKVVWLLNIFWEHDFLQLKKLRLIITQRWTMYGRFCRVNFPSLRHVWFIYFSLFSSVVTVKRSTRTSIWTSTLPKLFGYLGQLLQQLHSEVPLSWQLFNSFHRLSLISKRNIPSGPTEGVISFRGFVTFQRVCACLPWLRPGRETGLRSAGFGHWFWACCFASCRWTDAPTNAVALALMWTAKVWDLNPCPKEYPGTRNACKC